MSVGDLGLERRFAVQVWILPYLALCSVRDSVCVRACVRVCVRARARARARVCVCVCVCVCVL